MLDDIHDQYCRVVARAERLQKAGVAMSLVIPSLDQYRKEVKNEYVSPDPDCDRKTAF
jgi:hypothetical protein